MYRSALILTLIVALLTQFSTQSNILGIFPHFGYSHFKVFSPLLRGLAEKGHNVTVITYVSNPEPHPNYEELLLTGKKIIHDCTMEEFPASRSLWAMFEEFFALHSEGQESCVKFYESGLAEEILRRHESKPYDLVITEFFNTDCHLGIPYLLQVPIVGLSSCALMPWYYDRIMLPDTPAYVQSEFIGFPEVLNWKQRMVNLVQAKVNKWLYRYHTNSKDNEIIRKYLKVDVDVNEIAKAGTSLVFVNQHYSLSGSQPSTPQLIQMGGIHVDERNIGASLPPEMELFLQQSPNGVLFISWGSMLRTSTINVEKLNAIIVALQKLQLRVLWKWEGDNIPIDHEQFMFTKWAPQLTLLCHPKVKLFWGHGGLLGTTEAVYCGKPMILTPIYGDQFLNANAVQNRKTGKILHYQEIETNRLQNLLQEVMSTNYSDNAAILSEVFRNRETTPLETTTWWIEHLLQRGQIASTFLRTQAIHLPWYVYYSLDSVALLLFGCFVSLLLVRFVVLARFRRSQPNKVKKS